jgi:hypothetical protein
MTSSSPSYVKSEPTGPPASSSIFVDAPVVPSNEIPLDHLHGYSAPTQPVYINIGRSEQTDDVNFAGPITTTNPPLSPSLASIPVDQPLPPTTVPRHDYLPHRSQIRNRYPYLPSYERRSKFPHSYFALSQSMIPKGIEKNSQEIFY